MINGIRDHQDTLLKLIRAYNVKRMVEVGVASGQTSELLLRECPELRLALVDQWKAPSGDRKQRQAVMDRARLDLPYKLMFAAGRYCIFHMPSIEAAFTIYNSPSESESGPGFGVDLGENGYDLIFIDAHHGYESVLDDCSYWWDCLRSGGIFCGHDIDSQKDKDGIWGVRKAVTKFCETNYQTFTVDKNVWIVKKRGP